MRLRFLFLCYSIIAIPASGALAEEATITIFPASLAAPVAAPVAAVPVAVAAPGNIPVAATDAAPVPEAPVEVSSGDKPPRWYAAVSGSLVYLSKVRISPTPVWTSYDFSYGYSLATGYRVFEDVRWELEVSERESTVKNDSYGKAPPGFYWKPDESTAIMTNAYYDFHNASQFVPYLGAGVGEAYVRSTSSSTSIGRLNGWTPSYEFMAGLSYEFTDTIAMNAGYRYFSGRDVNVNGSDYTYPNTSHNIEAGLRWFFN